MKVPKHLPLYALTIALFGTSVVFNSTIVKPPVIIEKQGSALNFSSSFLKLTFAGYHRLMADILWISTLLESDLEHYKNKDLNSWMYLRFNSISELDPKFLQNYTFGSQYLSIIKDDLEGAADLFEKGLSVYPNNSSLIFNAAFLYAFELGEPEKALPLYKKLRDFPKRPHYLESLIAKLEYEKSGSLESAYRVILEMYKDQKEDNLIKEKLRKDLYSIKATIDLNCLNSGLEDCSKKDFYGDKYIVKEGKFTSQTPFAPYELHVKKRASKN